SAHLYKITPNGAQRMGATNVTLNALAFAPDGSLFGAGGGALYRIQNPSTGTATRVGDFGGNYRSSGDIAFGPEGKLYGTVNGAASTDALVEISAATGAVTRLVGPTGQTDVYGLAVLDGVLYGATSAGRILRISTETGAATVIATNGVRIYGLAATSPCVSAVGDIQVTVRGKNSKHRVEGAIVALIRDSRQIQYQTSNTYGCAVFSGVAAGQYQILANKVNQSPMKEVTVSDQQCGAFELDISADAELRGLVRDEFNKEPVEGATVELLSASGTVVSTKLTTPVEEPSFDGAQSYNYRFNVATPGTYRVRAKKSGSIGSFASATEVLYQTTTSDPVIVEDPFGTYLSPAIELKTNVVALVHGINSSHEIWGSANSGWVQGLRAADWAVLDNVNLPGTSEHVWIDDGLPITTTTHGWASIQDQALELRRRLASTGVQSYHVVAHSQGGLVARHLLEVVETKQRAPIVVTLGTPHHGTPLVQGAVGIGVLSVGKAALEAPTGPIWRAVPTAAVRILRDQWGPLNQMAPNSRFIQSLNRACDHDPALLCESDWSGRCTGPSPAAESRLWARAQYISIAGNDPDGFLMNVGGVVIRLRGFCSDSDGAVPAVSARYYNTMAGNVHNYLTGRDPFPEAADHAQLYEQQSVRQRVISLLRTEPAQWPASTATDKATGLHIVGGVGQFRSLASGSPELLVDRAYDCAPGVAISDTFRVTGAAELEVDCAWQSGFLAFSLVSPSGQTIDSGTSAADPSTRILYSPNARLVAASVVAPDDGLWTINAQIAGSSDTSRVFAWVSAVRASRVVAEIADPEDGNYGTRIVTASLVDEYGGSVGGVTGTASVFLPDGTNVNVGLADDGIDPDLYGGDGVATGRILDAAQSGSTVVDLRLQPVSGPDAARRTVIAYDTPRTADLAVTAGTSAVSATGRAGAPVVVTATIANAGPYDSAAEVRVMRSDTGAIIAADTLSLEAGATTTISAEEVPLSAGYYSYVVSVQATGAIADSAPANNVAMAGIQIGEVLTWVSGVRNEPDYQALGGAPATIVGIPNPFNAKTDLWFELVTEERVELTVTDVAGRRVRTLISGALAPGRHVTTWDGKDGSGRAAASGVYLVQLRGRSWRATTSLILLK
ncbi:MAG: alpha/beta fold hydrolase, partial [Gammaproteobacteria bacterium]|nr:alpha/beta fold hydrolase [Gammaproteobacteria bacterium]